MLTLFVPLYEPVFREAPELSFSAVEEVLEVLMLLSTNKFPFSTDIAISPVAVTPFKFPTVPIDNPLP